VSRQSTPYVSIKRAWLNEHVLASAWMRRKRGADHFIVDSAARFFSTTRAALLDGPLANVTKLCIEDFVCALARSLALYFSFYNKKALTHLNMCPDSRRE